MCLNCLFVVSNADSNFELFLKRLLKQDTLKEMNLPYLESYLQSKMGGDHKESFQPADRSKWKTTDYKQRHQERSRDNSRHRDNHDYDSTKLKPEAAPYDEYRRPRIIDYYNSYSSHH